MAEIEAVEELNIDISNYWQAYGLTKEPFGLSADPSLYVSLPRWEEHLDLLQYLCHYNNLLLVVTGLAGSGKSTLLQQFVSQLAETAKVCSIQANPNFDSAHLLEMLAEHYGLTWEPETAVEEQLDIQIEQLQNQEQLCIVAIDNAHVLPKETLVNMLRMIRQQSDSQMRLHIVLFGEPSLQDNLAQLTEHDEVELVHALNLEPLDLEETQHYLVQRISAAGWQEDLPFSNDTISRIYRLSEGVPARINRIARRTLLDRIIKAQESDNVGFFTQHKTKIWGAGFIVIALIVFGLILNQVRYQSPVMTTNVKQPMLSFDQAQSGDTTQTAATTSVAKAAPVVAESNTVQPLVMHDDTAKVALSLPNQSANVPTQPTTQPTNLSTTSLPTTNSVPVQSSTAAETSAVTPPVVTTKSTAVVAAKSVSVSKDTAVMPAVAPVNTTSTAAQPVMANDNMPPLVADDETAVAVKTDAAKTKETKTVAAKPVKPVKTKKTAKATDDAAATVSSASGKYTADEEYLLNAPANHYTIQVIGLSDEHKVRNFVKTYHLQSQARYFRTQLNTKSFYILVYGNYATKAEATAAINNLPAGVHAYKPWVRDFARIHTSLQKRT